MRRSLSLLVLLGLPLGLVACDGDPSQDTEAGTTEPGTGDDTADTDAPEDTGEVAAPTLVVDAVRSLAPATLPEAEGGTVRLALRASATDDTGTEVPLDTAVAATTFAVLLSGGAELACSAEAGDDGFVYLEVDVPAGLAPGAGGRLDASLLLDGAPVLELPIRVHTGEGAVLSGFTGDPTGHVAMEDGGEVLGAVCDTIVVDADGDGMVEVLTVGVDDEGFRVTGCAAAADGDDTTWTCEDDTIETVRSSGGLFCGETDLFLVDGGGGVGVVGSAVDEEGTRHAQHLGDGGAGERQ